MTKADRFKDDLIRDYQNLFNRATEGRVEARRRLTRFLIGGNAGGAIATLSLIGTVLGSGGGPPFPRELFWVLAVFLVGLVSMWAAIAITVHATDDHWRQTEREFRFLLTAQDPPGRSPSLFVDGRLSVVQRILTRTAMVCLVIGTGLALYQLYLFSV